MSVNWRARRKRTLRLITERIKEGLAQFRFENQPAKITASGDLCARCNHLRRDHHKGDRCHAWKGKRFENCACTDFVEERDLCTCGHYINAHKHAPNPGACVFVECDCHMFDGSP